MGIKLISFFYGAIALSAALWLWFKSSVLLWLYLLAVIGLIADAIAVIKRKHKSILNEVITIEQIYQLAD